MALGSPLDALYVALQVIFIGAEGRGVPDEVAHEIWDFNSSKLPQKPGFCRGFAAKLALLASALARGLSWSVHVGVCFWKCDPGSSY